jgi:hypothetical protein
LHPDVEGGEYRRGGDQRHDKIDKQQKRVRDLVTDLLYPAIALSAGEDDGMDDILMGVPLLSLLCWAGLLPYCRRLLWSVRAAMPVSVGQE